MNEVPRHAAACRRGQIVEVAPRDGLQNEAAVLSTAAKLRLIDGLVAAGARRIEATSFVHPRLVPQMADAEAVAARLPRGQVSWIGLVLNDRGLDRAIAAGMDEVNVVVVASETFSQRNQGMTIADSIASWHRLARRAGAAGLRTTLTIAAAFGCPFEGEVAPEFVADVLARCLQVPPDELALADTIGVGVPARFDALADVAADCRAGHAAALALPQHPQHRLRQRDGRAGPGRERAGCQRRRDRWLPLRAGRDRQHRHRGPALPAAPFRRPDRHRPGRC